MKNKLFILLAACATCFANSGFGQDPNWVRDNTWFFDNFVKDTLPWSIFRETFIGVAPAPAGDFDQIFYSQLYQTKLAGPGHCYGMDVMAMMMMKNGGYLGYCHPPYVYSGVIGNASGDSIGPSDPTLRTAIEIAHGNQINHGFLSFLLDVIAISKNRDGRYAFQQVNYYLAKDDPPVISVTKGISPADGGHVLIPFFTEDLGATKKIYVYDPNRSFYNTGADGKDFYVNRNNFILVNNSTGAWRYVMIGGTTWSGNPGGGGNLITIPLSVAGRKDRLPQSLLADGAYALNTIFIFGEDAKVEQMTDPRSQRHLFRTGSTEWETRKDKRLTNILPFIPLGCPTAASSKSAVYFVRGQRPLDIQLRANGAYRIGMLFGGKYVEYSATGDGSIRHFRTPDLLHTGKKSTGKKTLLSNTLLNHMD